MMDKIIMIILTIIVIISLFGELGNRRRINLLKSKIDKESMLNNKRFNQFSQSLQYQGDAIVELTKNKRQKKSNKSNTIANKEEVVDIVKMAKKLNENK